MLTQTILGQARMLGGSLGISVSSAIKGLIARNAEVPLLGRYGFVRNRQADEDALRKDMVYCCVMLGVGTLFILTGTFLAFRQRASQLSDTNTGQDQDGQPE